MEPSPVQDYPRLCIQVGLTCEMCTSETARQLSRACKGLRGKMIGQLFVQIHPHPACAPMHGHFAEAYRGACSTEAAIPEPEGTPRELAAPRRGPGRERRRVMAAVA